jgi:hypothetical protein
MGNKSRRRSSFMSKFKPVSSGVRWKAIEAENEALEKSYLQEWAVFRDSSWALLMHTLRQSQEEAQEHAQALAAVANAAAGMVVAAW